MRANEVEINHWFETNTNINLMLNCIHESIIKYVRLNIVENIVENHSIIFCLRKINPRATSNIYIREQIK